jgi:hypothetical protein
MNSNIVEQQQIAYRCFISNTQQVLSALNKGISLADLATSCEQVCCHACTNGSDPEICNVNKWIGILIAIDKAMVLPTRIDAFLDYIILQHTKKTSMLDKFKKWVLFNTAFYRYEVAKKKIIQHMEMGYGIEELIDDFSSIFDSDDYFSYIRNWLPILQKAENARIIPGGNLLEFLKFI